MFNKKELKEACMAVLDQKISVLKSSIKETQDSSNNETKSTAGDKHETSRAMAQLEVERLSAQLHQQERLRSLLSAINTSESQKVESGAIVKTDKGLFYMSIALGTVRQSGEVIMTVGMGAPISQLMLGLKDGDSFSFNGNKYYIEEIF
ncbi:3-oxoacyl-ACP synthase [Parvicella tangerina]|uniref:3-oxoacyl-ACP synthase n=1 Tax=Parvicella tangerina TaxID=2829795 RepID=A0A916JP43_9FLAO|nr:3-oxoacyl-ACP synthase [Parvicella tangerina]CAG5082143.1 hypothetical protein CRYO30217_01819 [Parvicella tangerina]